MIVQALMVLQGEDGCLSKDRLRKLSQASGIPLYRYHEVASFFPHFRFEGEEIPAVEVQVCHDMACHLAGSNTLREELHKACAKLGGKVHVKPVSCLGRCDRAPAALVGNPQLCEKHHANGDEHHTVRDHLFVSCERRALYDTVVAAAGMTTPEERQSFLQGRADRDSAPRPDGSVQPASWGIDPYVEVEGKPRRKPYAAVEKLIAELRIVGRPTEAQRNNPNDPESLPKSFPLLRDLLDSNLRGMGGAGQPAFEKWRDVWRGTTEEKYVVVNADESEPATFKDRELLLHKPHLVVEGVILAGLLFQATRGYIYIRHEYPEEAETTNKAIKEAERLGYCGRGEAVRDKLGQDFPIEVFISPGGYICGEASALIEAMEDHRAEPRNKPPALEANGLYGKPTLVSNVETFAWVPALYINAGTKDAEGRPSPNWYLNPPGGSGQGRRFFSVCGDVARPGVYEVPIGISLREFLEKYCKGMKAGKKLKAFAPSGPSGGFLPEKINISRQRKKLDPGTPPAKKLRGAEAHVWNAISKKAEGDFLHVLDMEMEIDFFRQFGAALGAGIAFYAEGADIVDHAVNYLEFFRNETCGKCVPCRLGSRKITEFLTALKAGEYLRAGKQEFDDTVKAFRDLIKVMQSTSICGLGAAAPVPLQTLLDYFEDWKKYVPTS